MVIAPLAELERNRQRHTLIGLLFETPEAMSRRLARVGQASGAAARLVGKVSSPIVNSRLVQPLKRRVDNLGRAALRLIGYSIAALPLFLGFIWILFDNRRQG
jgi:hypothetical protein